MSSQRIDLPEYLSAPVATGDSEVIVVRHDEGGQTTTGVSLASVIVAGVVQVWTASTPSAAATACHRAKP